MKLYLLTCGLVLLISKHVSSYLVPSGPYKAVAKTVQSIPDITSDAIDFRIYMKRISRADVGLFADINFLRDAGPIYVNFSLEKWGDGGYKKWLADFMNSMRMCERPALMAIVNNMKGDSKIDTETCVFPKGSTKLENFDIDKAFHELQNVSYYGKYRLQCLFMEGSSDAKPFVGLTLEVEAVPL